MGNAEQERYLRTMKELWFVRNVTLYFFQNFSGNYSCHYLQGQDTACPQHKFRGGWFSLIAGYVEVGKHWKKLSGESKGGIGIDIKNIRYYKSQPWPLSESIMVGFIAETDDNQTIIIDNKEIVEAKWFTRGNLPDHSSTISIAGELIEKFEKGEL